MLHFHSHHDEDTSELVVQALDDGLLAEVRVPWPGTLDEVVAELRTAVCARNFVNSTLGGL